MTYLEQKTLLNLVENYLLKILQCTNSNSVIFKLGIFSLLVILLLVLPKLYCYTLF